MGIDRRTHGEVSHVEPPRGDLTTLQIPGLIVFLVVAFLGISAVRSCAHRRLSGCHPGPGQRLHRISRLGRRGRRTVADHAGGVGAGQACRRCRRSRSVSLFGLSYVSVYFEDDMDVYFAPTAGQ